MGVEFIKKGNLLSFAGTKCLRNDYAHHDCTFCIDICPEGALLIERGKYTIKSDLCTSCAVCLGSCPTEALTLESFDPNSFVLALSSKEEKTVSCKKDAACLGSFDLHHYMTMALKNEYSVTCDLSHCSTCTMSKAQEIHDEIVGRIELANGYLAELGLKQALLINHEASQTRASRFSMFKKAHSTVTEVGQSGATELFAAQKSPIPLKMVMLKNALREHMRDIKTSTVRPNMIFTYQDIDFDQCTNCQECTMFCPTKALYHTDDKQSILFKGGDCIGCGICHEVCKPNAITNRSEFDLVNVIYDRVEELVHYEMAQCQECKCAYPYKGGEQICDRCYDFSKQHAGMFTLARDM